VRRYRYRHYGFTLAVNRALPRLAPGSQAGSPDIRVEFLEPGRRPVTELDWERTDPRQPVWRAETPQGSRLRLRYAEGGRWAEFVIDERGASVSVYRSAGVELLPSAELLQGPVFSCILAQRGLTCLHASVVQLDGRTVAVLGHSGTGKSTTALALLERGGRLIADDVAVLGEADGRPTVRGGSPRLRMRTDAGRTLLHQYDSLESVWGEAELDGSKRYLPVASNGSSAEQGWPLDAAYFLAPWGDDSAPSIRAVTGAEALPRLMSYRHVPGALDRAAHRRDFAALARLTKKVPARDLRRPYGLDKIAAIAAAISCDVGTLFPTR
jgi:HPr Serine kinase C-terminal domain